MTARPRPGPRGHRRGGFLVVEALTTLALGALVIAGLSGVIVMMLRFSDRTAADLQRREVLGRAVEVMEREIRAMTRVRLAAGERSPFLFAGRSDRMLFTLERTDETGLSAPVAVAYRIGTRDGVTRLARAEAPVPPAVASVDGLAFGKPGTLYAGDRGLSFAYFSTQADGSGEVLVDDWKEPGRLPTAVRVAVTAPDGTVLESARVPLLVDAEPGCAAPGKGFCSLPGAEAKAAEGEAAADAGGRERRPEGGAGRPRPPGGNRGNGT